MTDQLIRLTQLEANCKCSKEELFNWIVDLEQYSFDELCNHIISLYQFQQAFEGLLVTDEADLLIPWLPVLPKIIFTVDTSGSNYNKKYFYQFLSSVGSEQLQTICNEVLSLYAHAKENNNTYVISQVYPAVAGHVECWRVQFKPKKQFSDLPERIKHWMSMKMTG
jgi:hypothetical protein